MSDTLENEECCQSKGPEGVSGPECACSGESSENPPVNEVIPLNSDVLSRLELKYMAGTSFYEAGRMTVYNRDYLFALAVGEMFRPTYLVLINSPDNNGDHWYASPWLSDKIIEWLREHPLPSEIKYK